MTDKKKKGAAAGAAAIFASAMIALFGISGEGAVEVEYSIVTQDSVCEMSVNPPEEARADILELYCNDGLVTKTVLPNGTLKSLPLVFSDLENLELRFYKLNEVIGIGKFKGKKLYVAFGDGILETEKTEGSEDAEK